MRDEVDAASSAQDSAAILVLKVFDDGRLSLAAAFCVNSDRTARNLARGDLGQSLTVYRMQSARDRKSAGREEGPRRSPVSDQNDRRVAEMFAQQALGERDQCFASLGQDECAGGFGPFQLEAGGQGRDPDLADGRVGRDHKLGRTVLEDNVHHAIVIFELKAAGGVFGSDEGLLQGFEGVVGLAAKAGFVKHGSSVVESGPHTQGS